MDYQGSCHCGAIRFRFSAGPLQSGVRCNCSICQRKGALMTPFVVAPDAMVIEADGDSLQCYRFGSGVAAHYFCRHCGVYTFHQTLRKPGHYRINIGCLDGADPFSLPVELFDGAAL